MFIFSKSKQVIGVRVGRSLSQFIYSFEHSERWETWRSSMARRPRKRCRWEGLTTGLSQGQNGCHGLGKRGSVGKRRVVSVSLARNLNRWCQTTKGFFKMEMVFLSINKIRNTCSTKGSPSKDETTSNEFVCSLVIIFLFLVLNVY